MIDILNSILGALTTCSVQWQDKSFSVWTYNISMFVFVLVVPVTAMAITNWKLYMTVFKIYCGIFNY
jgi:hypothetical protein